MARLVTCGFEVQHVGVSAGAANRTEGDGFSSVGSPAVETTTVRSGAASVKCSGASNRIVRWAQTGTLGWTYYFRAYIRISGTPTGEIPLMDVATTAPARIASVRIPASSTVLRLHGNAGQIGSDSQALSADTWYQVELVINVPSSGNGTLELWIDGVQVASSSSASLGTTAIGYFRAGFIGAAADPAISVFVDDVAVNDDQGSNQNGRPGSGKIVLLKPTSDQQRDVGWMGGGGGTTNLRDAVDNTPPVGVAIGASSTDTTQIEDLLLNDTDTYAADTQTYSAAGIVSADQVKVVQAIANGGTESNTVRTLAVGVWNNPADQVEGTGSTTGAAAATYPSGWATIKGPVIYNPSVTLGSASRVRIRKGTSTLSISTYDLMGVYVEYSPPVVQAVSPGGADAAGRALTAQIATLIGGAGAAGIGAIAAAAASSGGALAAGSDPSATTQATPVPAGAIAQGVGPLAMIPLSIGAGTALGIGPSALVLIASGGGVAGGVEPREPRVFAASSIGPETPRLPFGEPSTPASSRQPETPRFF